MNQNLAACLANTGQRTLLADCDPQANASEMFIAEEEIEFDFRSIMADLVPTDKVIRPTRIDGLDVLPASFSLAYLDKELIVSPNGVQRIEKALRPVMDMYDMIVLDTEPNLSHLTLGALVAPSTRIGREVVDNMKRSRYPTFETTIPKRIRAEDAVIDKAVAGEPSVDVKFSEACLAFTDEVLAKLRQRRKKEAHRAR